MESNVNPFAGDGVSCLPTHTPAYSDKFCEVPNGPPSFIGCCPPNEPNCDKSTYPETCGYADTAYAGVWVIAEGASTNKMSMLCMLPSDVLMPGVGLPPFPVAISSPGGENSVQSCAFSANPAGCRAMGEAALKLMVTTHATTPTGDAVVTACPRLTTGGSSNKHLYTQAEYDAFLDGSMVAELQAIKNIPLGEHTPEGIYFAKPGMCASWCNAYTTGLTSCGACFETVAPYHCEPWCNTWTSSFDKCNACEFSAIKAPSWCNAYTCGLDVCAQSSTCVAYGARNYCASWCNHFTSSFKHCAGC